MIRQLFITDEYEMRRCQAACAKRVSITIGGTDVRDSSFRVYRGLVRSVEDFPPAEAAAIPRWRITVQA